MKKLLISLLAVLMIVSVMAFSVGAAPQTADTVGPYEGVFHGTVYAEDGSSAPLSLNLTQRGDVVSGTAFLGEGLTVDAGLCGQAAIPASVQSASGETAPGNPYRLQAVSTFDVSGIDVTVDLDGNITRDGRVLTAEAKIDLPFFCGNDPVLSGTLYREASA